MKTDPQKILSLFALAKQDAKYARMNEELGRLEDLFDKLVAKLSDEEQDIIWGFVCLSEEMNWYMLRLLCDRFDIE